MVGAFLSGLARGAGLVVAVLAAALILAVVR